MFFFASYKDFSERYKRFSVYIEDMGMVTFGTGQSHGKYSIKRDQFDSLREWDRIKYRDKIDYNQRHYKEIMTVAKAKECPEDDIWKMGQMSYYNMLQVLESIIEDTKVT